MRPLYKMRGPPAAPRAAARAAGSVDAGIPPPWATKKLLGWLFMLPFSLCVGVLLMVLQDCWACPDNRPDSHGSSFGGVQSCSVQRGSYVLPATPLLTYAWHICKDQAAGTCLQAVCINASSSFHHLLRFRAVSHCCSAVCLHALFGRTTAGHNVLM